MAFHRTASRRTLLSLLLLAGFGPLWAQQDASLLARLEAAKKSGKRPVVGLALSGGGARGFAHIGVLKALDELGLPVDRVAGTSMGSVVGGLLACGYHPSEIEKIFLRVDWSDIFRNSAPRSGMALFEREGSGRYLVSLPMEGFRIRLPAGFSHGDKITNLLSLLVVSQAGATSFDDLPIPFRAVATDLTTGERVSLASGSLPESIRASLAFPLFFTPVELNGRLLTDGGLSDNFPTDVAREMGAEIVIGSDVTSPLRGRAELSTPLGVGDQAISLAIVASARRMRALADAVVLPVLEGVTPADFHRAREIIHSGYEAAMRSAELREIAEALASLGPPARPEKPPLILGGVRVEGTDRFGRGELERAEASLVGKPLGPSEIPEALDRMLGRQYFQKIRFELAPEPDGKALLVVKLSENRAEGFNLSGRVDDKYGALGLVNLTARGLGGGDNLASLDLQAGSYSRFAAEFLHPSAPGTSFFLRPQGFWSNDFQLGYSPTGRQSEFVDRRWGFEVPAGNTFRNLGAVTLGYRFVSVDFHRDTGRELFPPFQGQIASLVLRSHVDTLDRAEIPDGGHQVDFVLEAARPGLGGDLAYDRARLDYSGTRTWHTRHALTTGLRVATSFGGTLPIFEDFLLGGEEYLWGLKREEIRGNRLAGIRAGYRCLVADLGNAFLSRIYVEIGADAANAWADGDHLDGGLIPDGYLSFLARSWVGPVRVSFGLAEGGNRNATFSIGHSF